MIWVTFLPQENIFPHDLKRWLLWTSWPPRFYPYIISKVKMVWTMAFRQLLIWNLLPVLRLFLQNDFSYFPKTNLKEPYILLNSQVFLLHLAFSFPPIIKECFCYHSQSFKCHSPPSGGKNTWLNSLVERQLDWIWFFKPMWKTS